MKDSISKTAVIAYIRGVRNALEEVGITIVDAVNLMYSMEEAIKSMPSELDITPSDIATCFKTRANDAL